MTSAFKQGFMDKLAELCSSARCSVKKAGFEKKADPTNKGIHDPNPLIREANRTLGFVPQAPGSYLENANTEDQFGQVSSKLIADYADKAGTENASPDVIGYLRAAGVINNSYFSPTFGAGLDPNAWKEYGDKKFMKNYGPGIFIGSYPYSSENVLKHEHGHYLDSKNNPELFFGGRVSGDDGYDREVRAWNEAGVPEDDPQRVAALATHRLGNGYNVPDKEYPVFLEERKRLHGEFNRALAENYKRIDHDSVANINQDDIPIYYNRETDVQMPSRTAVPLARRLVERAGIYEDVSARRSKPVKPNRRFYTSSKQYEKAMDVYRKRYSDWAWSVP